MTFDQFAIAAAGVLFLFVAVVLPGWLDRCRHRRAADQLTSLWDDEHYLDRSDNGGTGTGAES